LKEPHELEVVMFSVKVNRRNGGVRGQRTCAALEELESRTLLSAGHGIAPGFEIVPSANGTAIARFVADADTHQTTVASGALGNQASFSPAQLPPDSHDADGSQKFQGNGSGDGDSADHKADGASIELDSATQAIPDFVFNGTASTGTAVYSTVASPATTGWWQVGGANPDVPQAFGTVVQAGQPNSPRGAGMADGSAPAPPQDGQVFHDGENGATATIGDGSGNSAATWMESARASYFVSRMMAVDSTISISGGDAIVVTADSFRFDPRDFDLTNFPPPPPHAAAATELPQTATVQTTGQQSDPPVQLALAAMPTVTTQGEAATERQNAPVAAADSSAMTPSVHTNIRRTDEVLTSQYTGLAVNFGTNLAVTGLEWEVSAVTGTASSAAGREFVDGLLEADATALAQIANTLTLRLNDENAMLWKETLAFLGGAVLVGSYLAKERQSSRPPGKKAISARHLCVGEQPAGVGRYSYFK
jgi:hypothetical protein